MRIYERNLEKLRIYNPEGAEVIRNVKVDHGRISVVMSKVGLPVLKYNKEGVVRLLHSIYDPVKEARRLVDNSELNIGKIIIVFGFGLGYHVMEILKVTSQDVYIRVIEPDANVFKMAFQTIDLTPILDSKRVEQFLIGLDVDTVVDKVLRGVSLEEVVFFDYPPSISLNPTYYEKIRDSIPLKQMNFPKKNLHKKSITGCMITLNEKDFISRALDSVIPLVDEMVIVDGGSVDGTLDIISKYPKVKLIQNKMPEDFSQQRNIYLRHVTSDWILVIDSDEAFEPNFKDALHTLISIGRFTSFWFPRKNFCPNDSEYIVNSGPGYQKRLFQNQPGIHYEGRVHEDIVGLKGDHGFVLDISILHYGFLKPIEFRAEKLKKWDEWSGYNDSAILNRKFETKRYEGVKVKRTLRVVNYQQWKKMKEK